MAARRLIAVMLVLLFLSSLAAALAPVDRQEDETSTTTTSEPAQPAASTQGKLVRETLDARHKPGGVVKASVGDQLQLKVTAPRPGTVELVRLGPTEDVDPIAPARFDVLLDVAAGRYPVRILETGRRLGTIVVVDQPSSSDGVSSS
jgi:hypothetical protein